MGSWEGRAASQLDVCCRLSRQGYYEGGGLSDALLSMPQGKGFKCSYMAKKARRGTAVGVRIPVWREEGRTKDVVERKNGKVPRRPGLS